VKRPFRWAGRLTLAAAAVLLAAGLWTFTFVPAEGRLEHMASRSSLASGAYRGIPFTPGNPTHLESLDVAYRYRVDGAEFLGRRIGMGFLPGTLWPFGPMKWETRAAADWPVTVWHWPARPQIAVLHRGPDIVVIAMFVIIGWGLIRFSAWMERVAGRQHPDP